MSALTVSPAYTALLAKVPPRVIRTKEQNGSYLAALYELEQRQESWGAAEQELADLLTLLIENFEEKQYALPKASPLAVIEFLDGSARAEAEGPRGGVWDAEPCFRGAAGEARVE